MFGYIYKVTNLINNKIYIGQHFRSDGSLTELDPKYWGSGIKINNAFLKYGYNNFSREIICWCDSLEELNEKEKFYISEFDTLNDNIGYNIAKGGNAGNLICGYSEEEKLEHYAKISDGNKKAWKNPEIRAKYIKSFSNRSEEYKQKISKSLTGRKGTPMSEENKKKFRERNLGNKYGLGNKSRTDQKDSEKTKKKKSESSKRILHTKEWNNKVSQSLKGKPKTEEHKAALRKPKPKYYWLKPDGSKIIMDVGNASKHKDWIKLDLVINSDQVNI